MNKISILLPYKENFSPRYAGAVSLLVNDSNLKSKYKNKITVYGFTDFKERFHGNYKNIEFKKLFFESSNIKYAENFLLLDKKAKSNLIEVHNRPAVFNFIVSKLPDKKIILYFHNDPLTLRGSLTKKQRMSILEKASSIIFVSEWTKNRFFKNLDFSSDNKKVSVIYPSVNKNKFNKNKKKIIMFVGKLNYSKGFDIFCDAVVKILDKYKGWSAHVIGDEPRAKIDVNHPKLKKLGFLNHKEVLKQYSNASIAVGCSKWEEPMGRIGLEASSRGCATIVSNRGGLPETITHGIVLNDLTSENLFSSLEKLVTNNAYRKKMSRLAYVNFRNDLNYTVKQIDNIRDNILKNNIIKKINTNNIKSKLRILHVTNFAERHDGRLYFVSIGQKISNGFIRLGHSVLNYSDRDMMKIGKNFLDFYGKDSLNSKLIDAVKNYNPDLLLFGHTDLIDLSTLEYLKNYNRKLKIAQWFEDPLIKNGPDYEKNKKKVLEKLDFIDSTFITTSPDVLDFKIDKSNFYYMPIPVDDSVERLKIFENNKYIYDMFFAMSHGVNRGVLKWGKLDGREEFINTLIKNNPEIKFDVYGLNGKQPIWAENFFKIVSKSKMALNLSRGEPKKYYSSNRIASLLGNGLLTFIDKKTHFGDFFSNDEIVLYDNIEDLSEKVKKYAIDDKKRNKIAKNGWRKYHQFFSSKKIAGYLLKKIFHSSSKESFLWEK